MNKQYSYILKIGDITYEICVDGFVDGQTLSECLNDQNRDVKTFEIADGVTTALKNWLDGKKDAINNGKQINGALSKVFDDDDFKTLVKEYCQINNSGIAFSTKNKLINNLGLYGIEKGFKVGNKTYKVFFNSFDYWNYNAFKKSIIVKENIEYFKQFKKTTKKGKTLKKEFDAIEKLIGGE